MNFIGQKLGPYRILKHLGRGGQGDVYLAKEKGESQPIALKILRAEHLHNSQIRERFIREAAHGLNINHRHLMRIYSISEAKLGDLMYPYIAMRYIEGGTLADSIHDGPMSLAEACRVITHVASGLTNLHKHGIVHRDIKPSNILYYAARNEWILSDFGISKAINAPAITVQGKTPLGTPQYMSPEQVLNEDVTQQSDIYSLGVLLFRLVVGRFPWPDGTLQLAMLQYQKDGEYDCRRFNGQLPIWLDKCIRRATDKDPKKRFEYAYQLANEFQIALTPAPRIPSKKNSGIYPAGSQKGLTRPFLAGCGVMVIIIFMIVSWPIFQSLRGERVVVVFDDVSDAPSSDAVEEQEPIGASDEAGEVEAAGGVDFIATSTIALTSESFAVTPVVDPTASAGETSRRTITAEPPAIENRPAPLTSLDILTPADGETIVSSAPMVRFIWEGEQLADNSNREYAVLFYVAGSDQIVFTEEHHKQPTFMKNVSQEFNSSGATAFEWEVVLYEGAAYRPDNVLERSGRQTLFWQR